MISYLNEDQIEEIQLIKWPGCDVDGVSITADQAQEILVRTNGTYFSTNDRQFEKNVERILYEAYPTEWENEWWVYEYTNELTDEVKNKMETRWKRLNEYRNLMGILDLEYLINQRVCSSYVGGPHGWCDWNGNIFQRQMNIGKWPSTMQVYKEWKLIASTFPYLNLTCRLLNHEAGYAEDNPGIAIVYEVKDGEVKARLPYDNEVDLISKDKDESFITDQFIQRMNIYDIENRHLSEHGVSLENWKKACDHVAKIMTST